MHLCTDKCACACAHTHKYREIFEFVLRKHKKQSLVQDEIHSNCIHNKNLKKSYVHQKKMVEKVVVYYLNHHEII